MIDIQSNNLKITSFAATGIIAAVFYLLKKVFDLPIFYYFFLIFLASSGAILLYHIFESLNNSRLENVRKYTQQYSLHIIIVLSILYVSFFTIRSAMEFNAYSMRMFDFGNMDQAIWNMSKGRLFESTDQLPPFNNLSRFANHTEFIYFLPALLYKIWPNPILLLFLQSAAIAAGIPLLYSIALKTFKSPTRALILSIVYVCYPSLQLMNLFEFHADIFAIPFLLGAWNFLLVSRKRIFYWLFIILSLSCKEYTAFAVVGLGILSLCILKKRIMGTATIVLGFSYFFAVFFWLFPLFNNGNETAIIGSAYSSIGGSSGTSGILSFILNNPAQFLRQLFSSHNWESIFYIFFPLLFIPLLNPSVLSAIILPLLKDMLAGLDAGAHRLAPAVPILFIGLILGVRSLESKGPLKNKHPMQLLFWSLLISATFLAAYAYGPSPLGHKFWREQKKFIKSPRDNLYDAFVRMVPPDAALSVSDCMSTHCSQRKYCHVFPRPMSSPDSSMRNVSHVLIDTLDFNYMFDNFNGYRGSVFPRLHQLGFICIREQSGIFLFVCNGLGSSAQ